MVVTNCSFSMRNRSEVNDSRDDVRFLLRMLIRLFFFIYSQDDESLYAFTQCAALLTVLYANILNLVRMRVQHGDPVYTFGVH